MAVVPPTPSAMVSTDTTANTGCRRRRRMARRNSGMTVNTLESGNGYSQRRRRAAAPLAPGDRTQALMKYGPRAVAAPAAIFLVRTLPGGPVRRILGGR